MLYFLLKYDICESTIHIDIYFKENVQYQAGFNINTSSNHRDSILYLISQENLIELGNSFNINSGVKLEIYFSSNITTLESFFDHNYDPLSEKIVSIDFSNFNVSGFVSLKNIFNGCSSLVSVKLNNLETSSVLNTDSMFSGCSSLISIDLTGLNTESVTSMESMFNGCSKLKSIIFSSLNTASVTNMKSMFN